MAPYLEALHREIERSAARADGRTAQSVYFGGGTPSLLAPTALTRVLAHCRQAFSIASDAEITLEANPETVTADRVRAYIEAGVTRVSMGMQSLQDQTLLTLGRPHTADRAIAAYDAIREAGCQNINLDLLYGLPEQTLADWGDTLERTLALDPDHLSAYALTPEPGTEIGTAVEGGGLALPADDAIEQQETLLHDTMASAGLIRYEISNYAKPGRACRHNVVYWRCGDWIGLGASAHSHLAGHRWWNQFDPTEYIRAVHQDTHIAGMERLSLDQQLNEVLAFGLRMTDGVPKTPVNQRFGRGALAAKAESLAHLEAQGLVGQDEENIRLTSYGLKHADFVAISLF
jgi:oxygen-independent coproporphyrinogen-3 oxidase